MNDCHQPGIEGLIIAQMAEALIYSDAQGTIREWNAAAEALFGHSRAQALGRSLDLIIPENLRAAHWSAFDRAMASATTRLHGRATMTRAVTADGRNIYVEMSFALVTDADGKAIGSVAVARDATQRRQEEKELRARLAEAARDA
ncbi:MAG: PAS domain S-box protein [Dechloromonas sp.]|nr:MAG: PAS domain S-box protein [Dechloromonas sp.]